VYLIVGLGNPGVEYQETRHNIGFRVIEEWASELGISLKKSGYSRCAMVRFDDRRVILQCPLTFMNLSGKAVRLFKDYYKIQNEEIMVVHDDLDLPVGRIKMMRNGGSGGHKGVLSIIESLGSNNFARLRLGIGRPRYQEKVEEFVLSPFYEDEIETVDRIISLAIEGCELFIARGIDFAMNKINAQNLG